MLQFDIPKDKNNIIKLKTLFNDFKESDDNHPVSESHYNFYSDIVCPKLGHTPLKISF